MPITNVPQTCCIGFHYESGVNASGGAIVKSKIFQNVKAAAADIDVFAITNAIVGLQTMPSLEIYRTNESFLMNS